MMRFIPIELEPHEYLVLSPTLHVSTWNLKLVR